MTLVKPQQFRNIARRCASQQSRVISAQYFENDGQSSHLHTSANSPLVAGTNISAQSQLASQDRSRASISHAYWTEANLRDDGIFDGRDLLNFQTLHELQVNASIAFAENKLFGTYAKKEGSDETFEWMTFREYGDKVNQCRSVLKDLGKTLNIAAMFGRGK